MASVSISSAQIQSEPVSVHLVNPIPRRLRVRRVWEFEAARRAAERATARNGWFYVARHGGDVANAYGYAADTEACLAVSDPAGRVVVWMGRLPANKVTLGGACERCLAGSRELEDGRYGDSARAAAWIRVKAAHAAVLDSPEGD